MTRIAIRPADAKDRLFPAEMDDLLRRIYAARGISSLEMLDLSLSRLPSPQLMLHMDKAVSRLIDALKLGHRILIIGDFDADGATGSALVVLGLKAMGFEFVDYLVPNRFEFGYGLTPEIVEMASERKPDLILTVDNGVSSVEGVARARLSCIDVIVTDHHLPGKKLPDAVAIINPNQPGCQFPAKNLAGVGVAFFLLIALRSELRDRNWFVDSRRSEPNLASWLDLVALGTVADLVPLDHVNRILVYQGLKRIRMLKCRPGISALIHLSGKNFGRLVAADLGFYVGPRLNAAGRLDDMSLGIQCLIAGDRQTAMELALQLNQLNQTRKAIEEQMQAEAETFLAKLDLTTSTTSNSAICLYHPDWHQGVIGLLASRIKERFQRPVIVFARDTAVSDKSQTSSNLKGSCRSVPALHMRDALETIATQHPDLLIKFGGHAMAAGLSLDEENFEFFTKVFKKYISEKRGDSHHDAVISTDGELTADRLVISTADLLHEHGPWGQNFPEPRFSGEFILLSQQVVGERHLKLVLRHPEGGYHNLDAIHFNMDERCWPNFDAKKVCCVYRLAINDYKGLEKLQLLVEYIKAC